MSKTQTKIFFFVLLLFVSFTACNRPPRDVLSKKKMEEALIKFHLSEGIFDASDNTQNAELRSRYVQRALEKEGISPEKFQRSVEWYAQHPKLYEDIYNRVTERLKTMLSEAEAGNFLSP